MVANVKLIRGFGAANTARDIHVHSLVTKHRLAVRKLEASSLNNGLKNAK